MATPITFAITIDPEDLGSALALLRKLQADAERRRKRAPSRAPIEIDRIMMGAGAVLADALTHARPHPAPEPAPTGEIQRWIVLYTRIPTSYNNQQRAIVEAATPEAARALVKEAIGDRGKTFETYHIESVKPFEPLAVNGRVVSMGGR